MNYFELFELPPAPSVNKSLLARKYFELQKKSHPDFFTRSTDEEQDEALEQSAAINKAFNIFQDSQKTIEYFLQTVGLIIPNEKYSLPPGFLMEMMDINESLLEGEGDAAKQQVANYEAALLAEIEPVLVHYEAGKTTEESLLQLKEYYYKKKYLERILDRLAD